MKKYFMLILAIALIAGCSESVLDDDIMLKKGSKKMDVFLYKAEIYLLPMVQSLKLVMTSGDITIRLICSRVSFALP